MSGNLSNLNLAIIGVGAIGSNLLETLVRGGAKNISIWDEDEVEPGNICRSIYTLADLGKKKVHACADRMSQLSPFCKISTHEYNLYGKINYSSQETINKELSGFDIIIDCTASNELLHFLSYSLPNKKIISLCITNHAKDLLCLYSSDGNPYEQRKAFLSMIEQDTQNFYAEGTGCYSPTFLATDSHISYLVNMFVAYLYSSFENKQRLSSVIYSREGYYTSTNLIHKYKLKSMNIMMSIPEETLKVLNSLPDTYDYAIGYLLGAYSKDGKQIFLCNVIPHENADEALDSIFATSEGVIDYIGEFHYSGAERDSIPEEILKSISIKAECEEINTNNPLLAVRNPDGDLSFFLYINDRFHKFVEQ